MEKEFWKSKTMWAGSFALLYAVYLFATTGQVEFQTVMSFVGGLGIVGFRDAMN